MKTATPEPANPAGSAASPRAEVPAPGRSLPGALDTVVPADLRLPASIVVVVALGLVIAGQVAEDLFDSASLQMLPPTVFAGRWTAIAAVAYLLLIALVVDRTVTRSIPALDRALKVDAATFRAYVRRMQTPDVRVNLVLLAASALIVTVLFVGTGLSLPIDDPVTGQQRFLPSDRLAALAILAGYTVIGWAGLSLVYKTIRVGRALGDLCRQPLAIDVFDTSNLLPFGNIALATALAPAGLIIIMLLGLGEPSTWLGWTILLVAAGSGLLALLLPLRGIHRQMSDAKDAALARINSQIARIYDRVDEGGVDRVEVADLAARTGTLIPLRKTVQEMTTWPFADTVAFGRAVLIASAPLIYTVLNELIKIFWLNPLSS